MECYSEAVGSSGAGQDWNLERLRSVFNLGWKDVCQGLLTEALTYCGLEEGSVCVGGGFSEPHDYLI